MQRFALTLSLASQRVLQCRALFFLLFPLGLFLGGCAAVERAQMRPTEVYYLANTTERFAPKPRDYDMPVLSQPPRKGRVIGSFKLTTTQARDFVMKSALYNGRRVGADAIFVRRLQEWSEPYAYDIPAHWENRWETRQERYLVRLKGAKGSPDSVHEEVRPVSVQRMEWVPLQHVSGFYHFTSLDAEMYRLL